MSKHSPQTSKQRKIFRLLTSAGRRGLFNQAKALNAGLSFSRRVNGWRLSSLLMACLLAVFSCIWFGEGLALTNGRAASIPIRGALAEGVALNPATNMVYAGSQALNNFFAPVTTAPLAATAVYDSVLKAPKCASPDSSCDSGTLLNGRDNLSGGPEPNQPNTINNSCGDSTLGGYHADESIDAIKVSTQDASNLAPGKTAKIEVTVWAYTTFSEDRLDLYYAANASNPSWTYLTTLTPTKSGAQVLSTTYTLPSGTLQAVRARFRYQGTVSPCGVTDYADHDDLIFAALDYATVSGRIINGNGGGLSGRTVTLTSTQGSYTSGPSNGNGEYIVSAPKGFNYTATANGSGETFQASGNLGGLTPLNANVTGKDFIKKTPVYTAGGTVIINGNGTLTGVSVSGGPEPCSGPSSGGAFSCNGLSQDTSYSISPSKANYVFTPSSITVFDNIFTLQFVGNPLATVTTGSAIPINTTSVTLNGTVNPNGVATNAWFEWGTDSTLTSNTMTPSQAKSGTTNQALTQSVPGLLAGTTYYFRTVASNAAGTVSGTIVPFTTGNISGRVTTGNGVGLSGRTVSVTGTPGTFTSAPTNSNGDYLISAPPGFNYTVNPPVVPFETYVIYGQASGSLTPLTGPVTNLNFAKTTPTYAVSGDIIIRGNGDLTGLTVTPVAPNSPLPAPTPCPGPYTAGHYTCNNLWRDTSYDIVPAKLNYVFTPAPVRVTDVAFFVNYTGNPLATVITSSATAIPPTSASLNGTVNPNGIPTNAWFEWGIDPTLTIRTTTASQDKGSGISAQAVSQNLSGLATNTTYYFRAVGSNDAGVVKGAILPFSTTPPTRQITVQTNPAGLSVSIDGGPTVTAPQVVQWTPGTTHTIATTSPQAAGAGAQYEWTGWNDAGLISHSLTAPSEDTIYIASFTLRYLLTMTAGAGGTVSPASGYFNSGQSVQISATPGSGSTFTSWTGTGSGSFSGTTNPVSVTMNGPITQTANFTGSSVQVTVQTNPAGRTVSIDGGAPVTAPVNVQWTPGSSHTIATTSPQGGSAGTQYVWTSWSDGGAISHNVTAPSSATSYTANFTTQYLLTMNAGAGGTVSPASGYFNSGQSVQISATPGSGSTFTSWTGTGSGAFSGTTNPVNVTMNGPITQTASFTGTLVQVTVQTNPAGRTVSIDGGAPVTAPVNVQWTPGSSHTIATTSPQAGSAGTQYVWTSWSDGGAISHNVTAPSSATSYTANFTTQYLLTMSAGAGGTVSPLSGYFNSGQSVQISATPNTGFIFSDWTGTGSGAFTGNANPVNVTMNGPITESARFLNLSTTLFLLFDESGPAADQIAAFDSLSYLRDPFPVVVPESSLNKGNDRNTRVIVFVMNLQLAQGETPAAVVVSLIGSNNQSYDIPAEAVQTVPNFSFTQVIFRLPNGLAPGTCTVQIKAHGGFSNVGTMRIIN